MYFKSNEIIFLDADNGLLPESLNSKSKKSTKYINLIVKVYFFLDSYFKLSNALIN